MNYKYMRSKAIINGITPEIVAKQNLIRHKISHFNQMAGVVVFIFIVAELFLK